MSVRLRLAAVALGLLAPALVLARWMTIAESRSHETLTLPRLSGEIAHWKPGGERQLSAVELELLEPDAYLARSYEAPDRGPIWLYLALYATQSSRENGAHDPMICYPAQGWEIVATRSVDVRLPGGESFVGTLFSVHQRRAEQKVLFWFQPAARWPARQSRELLTQIWDALAGRPQYAFVRIAAPSVPGHDVEPDLLAFAAEIAWPIRRALSPEGEPGEKSPSSPAPFARRSRVTSEAGDGTGALRPR